MWKYQCMHMHTQTFLEVELKFEKDNVHVTVKDEPQVTQAKTYTVTKTKKKLLNESTQKLKNGPIPDHWLKFSRLIHHSNACNQTKDRKSWNELLRFRLRAVSPFSVARRAKRETRKWPRA